MNTAAATDNFYGLNRTRCPAQGEMEDMRNMSSDEYPCAAPCVGRKEIAKTDKEILSVVAPMGNLPENITGFTGVAGDAFYYNGVRKTSIDNFNFTNKLEIDLPRGCQWEIDKLGDMYILNGYNPDTKRSQLFYYDIGTDTFSYGGNVMPKMIVMIGNDDRGFYIEAMNQCQLVRDCVINHSDGTVFDCGDYYTLYHQGVGYITWKYNLFTQFFSIGDEIRIEGFRDTNEGQFIGFNDDVLYHNNSITNFERWNTVDTDDMATVKGVGITDICSMKVTGFTTVAKEADRHKMYIKTYDRDGDECNYFSLGLDFRPVYYAGVTISKKMPSINKMAVHQGRIWGSSPSGRYIYASASDNVFSFSYEDMTNKFAWRMPSDAVGAFTGFSSYNDELVAFKPDSISVITGFSPKNYQLHTILGIGCIASGSHVVTSKGIIFLTYDGFYIYNGSYPKMLGRCLNRKYIDAVSGYDGRKYYASATDCDGQTEFLVYDTLYGLWHREDELKVRGYFRFRDRFYVCDSNSVYMLDTDSKNVEWSMTLAQKGDFDLKGINEIWLRCNLEDGAEFTVYTDIGKGKWRKHATFTEADGTTVYRVPVRFIHSDSYRIKITGRGKVVVYGIELITSQGGRRHKERL